MQIIREIKTDNNNSQRYACPKKKDNFDNQNFKKIPKCLFKKMSAALPKTRTNDKKKIKKRRKAKIQKK
jgi:hypothetical protein